MTRPTEVPRLRARLAHLVAAGRPTRARAGEIRRLAERIATRTGQPLRRVLDRACHDAADRLVAEAFR